MLLRRLSIRVNNPVLLGTTSSDKNQKGSCVAAAPLTPPNRIEIKKNADFVDTMKWNVLRDLPLHRNHLLKSDDD
jgi:hypothetical protein